LNRSETPVSESPVAASDLGGLIDLIADGTISGRIAKDVFADMFDTGRTAADIVEDKGLKQVSDTGALEAAVDQVMADNPDRVADYRGGNQKLIGWFMGQIMKASGGKANPQMVNELLRNKLGS
jgi:aspartyl-tRNA(Asn)/glutamyl-tRNA(Gln) amidotransferase subunit B